MLYRFFKYIFDRIRGTARLEDKDDTACVCVGMQNSAKFGACPGAGVDATRMASLLGKYGRTVKLLDKQATASAVVSALREACAKDLCIFFYSGHGGRVKNNKAQDGSGYSEHLCLNNGALYDYTIWSIVSQAKGRVVMIFDCCHSATMFRDASNSGWTPAGFEFSLLRYLGPGAQSPDPSVMSKGPNILVWSGCPADNYSYGDDYGGVLTNAIRACYKESRTYDQVWDRAARRAYEQHPVRTVMGTGFDGRVFR